MKKHFDNETEEEALTTNNSGKKTLSKKHKIILAVVIVGIIVLVFGLIAWLYTGSLNGNKEKVFRTLPLPVAMVQSKTITRKDLYDRIDLAKKVLEASGQPTTGLEKQLLDQLIETKKIDVIVDKYNVKASKEDLENSYQAILKKFPNNNEDDFKKTLEETYGMDINTFKNEVVYQSVLQENLKLYFNQQESLNNEQYSKARDLIKQLDSGTSFEEVAKKYSEDTASKEFAGDSGFVKFSDMLPEFQTAIKDLSIGNTKIVASRYGIHVLRVNAIEGDSTNQAERSYNLQQIFIEPANFLNWLKSQTGQIKTVNLL